MRCGRASLSPPFLLLSAFCFVFVFWWWCFVVVGGGGGFVVVVFVFSLCTVGLEQTLTSVSSDMHFKTKELKLDGGVGGDTNNPSLSLSVFLSQSFQRKLLREFSRLFVLGKTH